MPMKLPTSMWSAAIRYVRLARGIRDRRPPRGQRRGHDRVLRRHDRGLVEVDVPAGEPVGAQLVVLFDRDPGSELDERVDVRVEPPTPDHVAARRRHHCPPGTRQQRPGEKERCSDPARELSVQLHLVQLCCVHANLVQPGPLHLDAQVPDERDHRLDVQDPRHVLQQHGLGGEQACGEDRQRPVLVPGGFHAAVQGAAALDPEGLGHGFREDGVRHGGGYRTPRLEPTRERAWETLTRYTESEALRRHALAVEASVRAYARKFGEDEEFWGTTALLHDFDWEIHPTLEQHPQDGAAILREEGYPEEMIEAILSHAEHLGLARDTPLKRVLFACDELSGFVHACGLVRPTGIDGLEPKSVKKKLKQPSFAAGVHRDEVYAGAELIGLSLDEHIANVVRALRPIASELGLRTG